MISSHSALVKVTEEDRHLQVLPVLVVQLLEAEHHLRGQKTDRGRLRFLHRRQAVEL